MNENQSHVENNINEILKELNKRKKNILDNIYAPKLIRKLLRFLLLCSAFSFVIISLVFLKNFFILNSNLIEKHVFGILIPAFTQGKFPVYVAKVSGNLLKGIEINFLQIRNPYFKSNPSFITIPKVIIKYSLLDVLFNDLIVEKVVFESPIIVLSRSKEGRYIWDFSENNIDNRLNKVSYEYTHQKKDALDSTRQGLIIQTNKSDAEKAFEILKQLDLVAKRFLKHFEINNLSIFVPSLLDIIPDTSLTKFLKFPNKTLQISNFSVKITKYFSKFLITYRLIFQHNLDIFFRKKNTPNTIQAFVTKDVNKKSYGFSFKTSQNQYELNIYNLASESYLISFCDSYKKQKNYLSLIYDPSSSKIVDKIKKLNASLFFNLQILNKFFDTASGTISFTANSKENHNVLTANYEISFENINLPILKNYEILNFSSYIYASNSLFYVKSLEFDYQNTKFEFYNSYVEFSNFDNIKSRFNGNFLNKKINFEADIINKSFNETKIIINSEIDSGQRINFEVLRIVKDFYTFYRDFKLRFYANLAKVDKLYLFKVLNLLFKNLNKSVYKFINTLKYSGKILVDAYMPSAKDWRDGYLVIESEKLNFSNEELSIKDLSGKCEINKDKTFLSFIGETNFCNFEINSHFVDSNNYELEAICKNKNKNYSSLDTSKINKLLSLNYSYISLPLTKINILGDKILEVKVKSNTPENWLKFTPSKLQLLSKNVVFELADFYVNIPINQNIINKIFTLDFYNSLTNFVVESGFNLYSTNCKATLETAIDKDTKKIFFPKIHLVINSENIIKTFYDLIREFIAKRNIENDKIRSNLLNNSSKFLDNLLLFSKCDLFLDALLEKKELSYIINGSIKSKNTRLGLNNAYLNLSNININLSSNSKNEFEFKTQVASKGLYLLDKYYNINNFALNCKIKSLKNIFSNHKKDFNTVFNFQIQSEILDCLSSSVLKYNNQNILQIDNNVEINFKELSKFSEIVKSLVSENYSISKGSLHLNLDNTIVGQNFKNNFRFDLRNISCDINIFDNKKSKMLLVPIKDINGLISLDLDNKLVTKSKIINFSNISAKVLDSDTSLEGEVEFDIATSSYKINLQSLNAIISKLSIDKVWNLVVSSKFYEDYLDVISDIKGQLDGQIKLNRKTNNYIAVASFDLTKGKVKLSYLSDEIKDISAKLLFKQDVNKSNSSVIELSDLFANILRTEIKIPKAVINSHKEKLYADVEAEVIKTYPKDMIKIFLNTNLPKINFPIEGIVQGKIKFSGDVASPTIETYVSLHKMALEYLTESQKYKVPFDSSEVKLKVFPTSGYIQLLEAKVGLLGGYIISNNGYARFRGGNIQNYRVFGNLKNLNLSELYIENFSIEGKVSGEFDAYKIKDNEQESVFKLFIENLKISELPVDQEIIDSIGLEFIKNPDFRVGNMNFYVSSLEDKETAGRLRIADGFLAGPDMRIEIQNSEFDPNNLSIDAKLIMNPQSLRKTTFGKKLGKMTKHLQDESTGLPYIDLCITGNWKSPKMLGRIIERKTQKRARKNFIDSIFGSRRVKKASVEDLIKWFPGWKPN